VGKHLTGDILVVFEYTTLSL